MRVPSAAVWSCVLPRRPEAHEVRAEAELSKRVETRGPRPGVNATKDLGEDRVPG